MKPRSLSSFVLPVTASLYEVVEKMEENTKGLVVLVYEDNQVHSIITDPDVRRLLLKKVDFERTAKDFSNQNFKYWESDESEIGAYAFLKRTGFRELPLLDKNRHLLGVLFAEDAELSIYENPVVIMGGGLGQRLRPLTENCPKPMVLVQGKPILERIIENLINQGFYRFIISINYLGEQIEEYFGDGHKWGISITYIREPEKLGTAGSLGLLEDEYRNLPLLVLNGDVLTRVNYAHLLEYHIRNESAATMCVRNYELQIPFGVIQEKDGQIVSIEEKPVISNYINAGIYCLSPGMLDLVCGKKRIDMPEVFMMAKKSGCKTNVFPVHEDWIDVGNSVDHQKAEQSLL